MKKIFALLMVVCLVFAFAACGSKDESSKAPANNNIEDGFYEEEVEVKEFPTLAGEEEYVVVCKKGRNITLNDITDIANYKVAIIRDTDSQLIGEYYCDSEKLAMHGTDQDAFSDLLGGNHSELVICRKTALNPEKVDILLDPIEMIELK